MGSNVANVVHIHQRKGESKMSANVMDFTDLGKGVEFSYKGENFEIPSYTKSQMTGLMEVSEKLVQMSRSLSEEERKKAEQGDVRTEEIKNLFGVQQEFICMGVVKKKETGMVPVTLEDINDWPWKLINKLVSMINKQMGSVNEGDSKSNPT
jgi:hypothetical protein